MNGSAKLCINNKKQCILRKNKNLDCCIDDVSEDIELLQPVLDKITNSVESNTFDKYIFSRIMFFSDLIYIESEIDLKLQKIIKDSAYLFYSDQCEECFKDFKKGFILESIKWFKYKLFKDTDDIDIYFNELIFLDSLTSDFKTIKQVLNVNEEETIYENIEFF
jgi:hypothetical protein